MKKWIGVALAAGVLGWFLFAFLGPAAPVLLSPDNAAFLRGHVPNSTAKLEWRLEDRGLGGFRVLPADHIVVCIDDPAILEEKCGEGGAVNFFEDWRLGSSHTRGQFATGIYGPVYDYEFNVTLSQDALDRQLYWTVGACRKNGVLSSCTFAESRTMFFNATDVAVNDIDDDDVPAGFVVTVRLENTGEVDIDAGDYRLATSVWEILALPENCAQLLTDVNRLNNPDTPVDESLDFGVILKDGSTAGILSLPLTSSGGRDSSDVYAIIRAGGISAHWGYFPKDSDDAEVTAVGPALAAGLPPNEIKPCESADRNSNGRCAIVVPDDNAFNPRIFAIKTEFDPQDTISEFDETNNQKLKRNVRIYQEDTPGACTVTLF